MKTKQMMVLGLAVLCATAFAGEASARWGNGGGGSKGQALRNGTCATAGSAGAATRPAGSQRRDGSFMTSGTTANGGAVRPGNGKGLQDGSRMTGTATPPAATAAP